MQILVIAEAGVVDANVHSSMILLDPVKHGVNFFVFGDIALERDQLPGILLPLEGLRQRLITAVQVINQETDKAITNNH